MKRYAGWFAPPVVILVLTNLASAQSDDAGRGTRLYRACAPCHSLAAGKNMTGPSLAELWNRQAGGLASFPRYSAPLKSSGIIWNENSLDEWIRDPAHFIPGTTMTFRGIKEAQQRADLLAFLKEATKPGASASSLPTQQGQGGMMGMMGSGAVPNLKTLDPEDRVETITYCADTYRVNTSDGKTHVYWERNLRFKTDSGEDGPQKKAPAIIGAGMKGDRADVIFAEPQEISGFIAPKC